MMPETLYGLKLVRFAEMIKWFKEQGFDPFDEKEFAKELKRRKMI